MNKYGKVTVGVRTNPEEINIESYVSASFKDHRRISISELEEDKGFILSVENPESTGRNMNQKMWLSRTSFIGLMNTAIIFWSCKGEDLTDLLKESVHTNELLYDKSDNLKDPNDW